MADGFDPTTFDPHDPAFLAEPWPTYERFREQAPLALVQPYGARWVFRYDDVKRVLTETGTFVKSAPGVPQAAPGPLQALASFRKGLFSSDPPLHTELREILEPALRTAIQSAPELAEQYAAPFLAKLKATERVELVADYATPVPSNVLFTVLGIPEDPLTRQTLLSWQGAIVAAHNAGAAPATLAAGMTCTMALRTFLRGLTLRYQRDPAAAAGMLGIVVGSIGDDLSADDVAASFQDLVIAGYLSTTWLIASGISRLLEHPDQLEALRADPSLMPNAIQEMLRFDGPVQVVDRVAGVDVELDGTALKAGDKLGVVVGSADHDPAAFPSPDEFDIRRGEQSTMGFGMGIHTCIGAPLVALVGPVALTTLLALPGLAVDGLPQWQTDPYLRGLVNLPMRVG